MIRGLTHYDADLQILFPDCCLSFGFAMVLLFCEVIFNLLFRDEGIDLL